MRAIAITAAIAMLSACTYRPAMPTTETPADIRYSSHGGEELSDGQAIALSLVVIAGLIGVLYVAVQIEQQQVAKAREKNPHYPFPNHSVDCLMGGQIKRQCSGRLSVYSRGSYSSMTCRTKYETRSYVADGGSCYELNSRFQHSR